MRFKEKQKLDLDSQFEQVSPNN